MDIRIPAYVNDVIERLETAGYEAYIVGGCVRDSLLGKAPDDYDVTTSARPEEVKAALGGYRIIDTGIKHGTVTVLSGGNPIEVTTYRCDGEYTDHRRPDNVALTRSLREDLSRRDFTVNALAYNSRTGMVDLFGGREDLEKKLIRCVGDPAVRFEEDALRIMRALRFAATLGFGIDRETEEQIHKKYQLLSYVSEERIAVELKKLLSGEGDAVCDILVRFSDVICHIIPEMKDAVGLDQKNKWHIYDVYTHIVRVVSLTPARVNVRLAALLHDIAKPRMMTVDENGVGHFYGHPEESAKMARVIMRRLKMDNVTVNAVCRLIEIHDIRPEATRKALRRYLSKNSDVDTDDIMAIRRADLGAQNPEFHSLFDYLAESEKIINELKAEGACLSIKDLAINGYDIIALGAEGELVGRILEKLLSEVVDESLENSKEELQKRAEKLYKSMK